MQLYNNIKVVPASEDTLWTLPAFLPDFEGRRLLVISAQVAAGSAEETTLKKMMAACKLHEADYALIQLQHGEQISWQLLAGTGAPAKVLLLGIAPVQIGIAARFEPNKLSHFLGGGFVWSYTLAQIAEPATKKALWDGGLKPMFGL